MIWVPAAGQRTLALMPLQLLCKAEGFAEIWSALHRQYAKNYLNRAAIRRRIQIPLVGKDIDSKEYNYLKYGQNHFPSRKEKGALMLCSDFRFLRICCHLVATEKRVSKQKIPVLLLRQLSHTLTSLNNDLALRVLQANALKVLEELPWKSFRGSALT